MTKMTHEQEDRIITEARAIQRETYLQAEVTWALTDRDKQTRPWSRCNNITCNRTLVCQEKCEGFDF